MKDRDSIAHPPPPPPKETQTAKGLRDHEHPVRSTALGGFSGFQVFGFFRVFRV